MNEEEDIEHIKKMIRSEIDAWYDSMMERYESFNEEHRLNMMLNVSIGIMMNYLKGHIELGYVESVKNAIIQSIEKNIKLSVE